MNSISEKNFGVVIAFLIPGFLVLWGLSFWYTDLNVWLGTADAQATTVGGFFLVTLASLSIGLALSAVRWFVIDHLLQFTGTKKPELDFGKLKAEQTFLAFEGVVQNHYRYYQYYSNTFVAIVAVLAAGVWSSSEKLTLGVWSVALLLAVCLLFGARHALGEYYKRSKDLIG